MSLIAHLIPVTQKAANVCAYCRVRKQSCDRTLPRCERCAVKGQQCDYTPKREPPRLGSHEVEPLVLRHRSCSCADISPRGATELLHAIVACTDASMLSNTATPLMELVLEILYLAEFDLFQALGEFGRCIQQWCPIIGEDLLLGCENDLSRQLSAHNGPKDPLLWLCLWLVTRKPCQHQTMGTSELYRAMKQVQVLLQSRGDSGLDLSVLRMGMLIALYEVGHGLRRQALQTLASCTAALKILELETKSKPDDKELNTVQWLKASLITLDRMILISTTTDLLPPTVLSSDPISTSLANTLGPDIPAPPPHPYASSPRKVHIRSAVSIASGQVLEYVHARQFGLNPEITYNKADEMINDCIKMLIDKPEPHSWLHCDAIAMSFCSHILLQRTQMQHLCYNFEYKDAPEDPTSEYAKVYLALQFSQRMAWDMVRVCIQILKSEQEIPNLPFGGICCVLRAGLAVLETREFIDADVIPEEELEGYMRVLKWFSSRWSVGVEYLASAEELLRRS